MSTLKLFLGILGCFAFTECGAGVLSGACVETTAEYNATTKKFTIHSPTESSKKKWISQVSNTVLLLYTNFSCVFIFINVLMVYSSMLLLFSLSE